MKDSYYEEEEEAFDNEGMGTQIRPKYKGSHKVYY